MAVVMIMENKNGNFVLIGDVDLFIKVPQR